VFSFGANDATLEEGRPRVSPDASAENARVMVSEALRAYRVLVVGPPPAPEPGRTTRHADLAARYATVCTDLGVPFLDVVEPLRCADAWWRDVAAGDGIHPNAGGYAALAALVEAWSAWREWLP
jgi:lysophospholipase L1-like esterase